MESLEDVIVFLFDKNLELGFKKDRSDLIVMVANSFNVDWPPNA